MTYGDATHGLRFEGPTTAEPNFSEAVPLRDRFLTQMRLKSNQCGGPAEQCTRSILRLVQEDQADVLSDFREALDYIDETMSEDSIIRSSLHNWRDLLGRWRKKFANEPRFLDYIMDRLRSVESERNSDLPSNAADIVLDKDSQPGISDFEKIYKESMELASRANATFQAIMSTMAIIESQKAITQAEEISKLTELAFFFIPLTFVASLFGMNVAVGIFPLLHNNQG